MEAELASEVVPNISEDVCPYTKVVTRRSENGSPIREIEFIAACALEAVESTTNWDEVEASASMGGLSLCATGLIQS